MAALRAAPRYKDDLSIIILVVCVRFIYLFVCLFVCALKWKKMIDKAAFLADAELLAIDNHPSQMIPIGDWLAPDHTVGPCTSKQELTAKSASKRTALLQERSSLSGLLNDLLIDRIICKCDLRRVFSSTIRLTLDALPCTGFSVLRSAFLFPLPVTCSFQSWIEGACVRSFDVLITSSLISTTAWRWKG